MYTEVSKLPAESFTIENLRDNFSNFLDNLEKINSALSFFEENNSFQNSHKTIKLLVIRVFLNSISPFDFHLLFLFRVPCKKKRSKYAKANSNGR